MYIKRITAAAALLALALSCSREALPGQGMPEAKDPDPARQYENGVVNIKFTEDMAVEIEKDIESNGIMTKASVSIADSLRSAMGIVSMERLFPYAGEYEDRTRKAGLHRWYRVEYDPSVPVTKAADGLGAIPGVDIVEPVRKIKSTASFNDPRLPLQWHYYNAGTLTPQHHKCADINVVPVWQNYTVGKNNVIVSVVDGGIDYTHEDLAANYRSEGSYNYVDLNSVIVPHPHGTHVAGTIAAVNNNGKGVSGVAGGDAAKGIAGVQVMSAQIFKTNPDNPSKDLGGDGARAIKESADRGAVISQNSWGYSFENPQDGKDVDIEPSLREAVDYFIKNAGCDKNGNQRPDSPMKGGVVIFAAGNDGMPFGPPAHYEPIVAVGSIAPDFTRAYYSNYGPWVDIAAPGGSAKHDKGQVLSTVPGSGYGYMQGTSMACPHVSGIAALLVSYFGGPGFTNEMLKERLLKGANKNALSSNTDIGPLADALGSFTYGSKVPPSRVTDLSVSAVGNTIGMEWSVTADSDDKKAYGFVLAASKDRSAIENLDFGNIPSGVTSVTVLTEDRNVGDRISGRVGGLDFESVYYVSVSAFDYSRNYSSASSIKEVRTLTNNTPVITMEYDPGEGGIRVSAHKVIEIPFDITDPDGHEVSVSLAPGSAAASGETDLVSGKYVLTLDGVAAEPGKYTAVITATDPYGASDVESVGYEIMPNHAPEVVKNVQDIRFSSPGEKMTMDITEYVSDEDGEILSSEITVADPSVVHISPDGNTMYLTALSYGSTDVSIRLSDAKGESCSLSFRIAVGAEQGGISSVEVYPNPVTDFVHVSTDASVSARIRVVSSSGAVVYDKSQPVGGGNSAARIDLSGCAPGRYTVVVSSGDSEVSRSIVKL